MASTVSLEKSLRLTLAATAAGLRSFGRDLVIFKYLARLTSLRAVTWQLPDDLLVYPESTRDRPAVWSAAGDA